MSKLAAKVPPNTLSGRELKTIRVALLIFFLPYTQSYEAFGLKQAFSFCFENASDASDGPQEDGTARDELARWIGSAFDTTADREPTRAKHHPLVFMESRFLQRYPNVDTSVMYSV